MHVTSATSELRTGSVYVCLPTHAAMSVQRGQDVDLQREGSRLFVIFANADPSKATSHASSWLAALRV